MSVHNVNAAVVGDGNARAQARAGTVLSIYSKMVGGNNYVAEDAVSDLLTDLRHHCASVGVDFDDADRRAANNFADERVPRMTVLQREKLQALCSRYGVPFRFEDYRAAIPPLGTAGWFQGWVGGDEFSGDGGGRRTIYVGVSPTGESHS